MPEKLSENGQAGVESECSELWDAFAGVLENLPAENLNNIVRDLDELEERWNNSLAFGGPLTKYYLDGRLDILVRCRIGCGENFYVFFRAKDGEVARGKLREPPLDDLQKADAFYSGGPYHCERSVFVFNVQVMKQTEASVPSLAWVQSANNVANFLTGTLYFSDRTGWQIVVVGADNKTGFNIGGVAVEDHGLTNQVIEGGSEVVDTIADDQAPLDRNFGPELVATKLRVTITDKKVRACLPGGLDSIAKVIDVMYGPFDLGSRPKKNV